MRGLFKATKYIGFALLGIGGGAMDSASMMLHILVAFMGVGMIVIGSITEEKIYG